MLQTLSPKKIAIQRNGVHKGRNMWRLCEEQEAEQTAGDIFFSLSYQKSSVANYGNDR